MIPKIDPDVKYMGSSKLRGLTSSLLRGLTGAIVVQSASAEPLAVILPYSTYLAMQESMRLAIEGVARVIESSGDKLPDGEFERTRQETRDRMAQGARRTSGVIVDPVRLDAIGPELSSGRGKATTETRGPRQKGDETR